MIRLTTNDLNIVELYDGNITYEVAFNVSMGTEDHSIGQYECHGFVGYHSSIVDVIESWDIVSIKKYNVDGEQIELLNTDADRVDLLLGRQLKDFEVVK